MRRLLILLLGLFLITNTAAQNAVIKTNFGNDANDGGRQVLSHNKRLLVLHKNERITLWDLKNKVVLYTVEPEFSNNSKKEPFFGSVSFSTDNNYLGYFLNTFNVRKNHWYSTYNVYDIKKKSVIKSIILKDVFYGHFVAVKEVLIKDCSWNCQNITWYKLNIDTQKKTKIKYTEAKDDYKYGASIMVSETKKGVDYNLILDSTSIYLFDTRKKSIKRKIESPQVFEPDTTYLTDISITKDLNHLIFLRPKKSAIVDLLSGKVLYDNLPFPTSWSYNNNNYGFNGLKSNSGDAFLYIDKHAGSTNMLHINSFNLKTKTIKTISKIKNNDYEIYKFINGTIGDLYDFSSIKSKINFKLTCHSVTPKDVVFGMYNQYYITAFNDFKFSVFNTSIGENKQYVIPYSNKIKYPKNDVIAFYNNSVLLAYNFEKSDEKVVRILSADIKSGKVQNVIDLKGFKSASELLVTKDNSKLLIVLKNKGIGDTQFLYDLKTFKNITPELFENRCYNTVYLTNNNKYIIGYIKDKGSYVFNNETKEFVFFHPNKMVFIHKEEIFLFNLEKNIKTYEYEDYCSGCKDGVKIVKEKNEVLTGNLLLKNSTNNYKINIGNFYATFIDEIDKRPINIKQDGFNIKFSNNGYDIFNLDLKTKSVQNFEQELFEYPKLINGKKERYLVGIELGDNGTQLAVSKSLKEDKYTLLEMPNTGSIYDYNYISNDVIITSIASLNVSHVTSSTNLNEEAEFFGYENPEKHGTFPFIKFSMDEKSYYQAIEGFYNEENAFDDVFLEINHKDLSEEEKVIFEEASFDFYNFHTKKRSVFSLENTFLHLADVPFIGVENKIYVFDKTANKTLEVKVFDKEDGLYSKITPWKALYKWKLKNTNKGYSFKENSKEGIISLKHNKKTAYNAQIFFNDVKDFFITYKDGYYMCNKEFLKYAYFEKGSTVFRPEQFDLRYNRPDIVLERLGYANKNIIKAYNKMYYKRLNKLGIDESNLLKKSELPIISVKNKFELPSITNNKSVKLTIVAEDVNSKIDKVQLWINDVPVVATNDPKTPIKSHKFEKYLEVSLGLGSNKIQVSVLNENGLESLKETVLIECTQGKEKPDLYLISIGVSNYKDTNYNLQYAAKDANDVVNQFSMNKQYKNIKTKLLTNSNVTKNSIASIKEFLKPADIDDVVIVFVASHGLLDTDFNYYLASHDIDFQNPKAKGIPFELIEQQLEGILPLKKIMFVDACHSGEVDVDEVAESNTTKKESVKVRGTITKSYQSKDKSLAEITTLSKALFSDLRRGNGTTIISAAGGLEFAFEGDKWKNGLFTYCLLNGISTKKADTNKDGKIMLSELHNYVTKEVSHLSKGKQTPTSRLENIAIDYRVW